MAKFIKGNKIGLSTRFQNGHKLGFTNKHHTEKTKIEIGKSRLKRKEKLGYLNSLETREKMCLIKKGKHISPETEFRKGRISPMKGKKNLNLTGNKNPNWKGGITPINQKIRGSLEYKLWQDSVFNRDGNNCQKCNENRISKLMAHHIKNFAEFLELRFAIDNGITFCKDCHKKFHKRYSKKNNTKEQLKEFLNQ